VKIVIIGGGPAGYVAAIRASQMGGEVTLIEKENVGGTCVNRGCIPTKAILKSVHPLLEREKIEQLGVNFSDLNYDINKIRSHSNKAVIMSRQGIEYLLKKNNVTVVKGEAVEAQGKSIILKTTENKEEKVNFDKLIIALGSVVSKIPKIEFDTNKVITSDYALLLKEIPKRLLIIGGGAVGLEFGIIYKALGSSVTIVEMMEQILPGEDSESVEILNKSLIKSGINVITSCKVENLEVDSSKNEIKLSLNKEGSLTEEIFDVVLVAAGRKPNINDNILKPLNVEYSVKGIVVNDYMQTSNPDVFAIGDINGKSMLAHTAYKEAIIASCKIFDKETKPINYDLMPRCVYSLPEFASVGKTKGEKSFVFPYSANGRARAHGIKEGMIKIFTEDNYITGCTIVGENATELIASVEIAIKEKIDIKKLTDITFPHPTFSEVFGEVCEVAIGLPLHI